MIFTSSGLVDKELQANTLVPLFSLVCLLQADSWVIAADGTADYIVDFPEGDSSLFSHLPLGNVTILV